VFNHVLIQLYRTCADHIREHADKTLDIERNSDIANYSLGYVRTMTLRSKEAVSTAAAAASEADNDNDSTAAPAPTSAVAAREQFPSSPAPPRSSSSRDIQKLQLPPNSLFVLGPHSNRFYLHSIKPTKVPAALAADAAGASRRLSFTFRTIATFRNRRTGELSGQGACFPCRTAEEQEELLHRFSRENKTTDSWEQIYGCSAGAAAASA